jgi:hypothetical protein
MTSACGLSAAAALSNTEQFSSAGRASMTDVQPDSALTADISSREYTSPLAITGMLRA